MGRKKPKDDQKAAGFEILLDANCIGKLTVVFLIRFDVHGMQTWSPRSRYAVGACNGVCNVCTDLLMRI